MSINPNPDPTAACRTTQHCASHGWCRRCAPDFAAVMSRVNVAIQRTDADEAHWGPLYAAVGEALRGAVSVVPPATNQTAPADRAATLREAADAIDAETRQAKAHGVLEPDKYRPCRDASAQLRRLAVEAGQAGGPSRGATEPQPEPQTAADPLTVLTAPALLATIKELRDLRAPLIDALTTVHQSMTSCVGDEWAMEWLGEVWSQLPLTVRAAAGDADAADELAAEAPHTATPDAPAVVAQPGKETRREADPDCERCDGSGLDPDAYFVNHDTGTWTHAPCSECLPEDDDEPEPAAERIKHSGPDTKFCVLCLSGEHERVDDEEQPQ